MPDKKNTVNRKLALTPAVEEGPYYKSGSPERKSIAGKGTPGTKLVLEGQVLDIHGNPIPHAWLDFWQADGNGKYDNEGYNLRGHQYADKSGRYQLETVRPKGYMMRSAHIHAKVRANDNAPMLTTQLFFPGERKNATDYLFEKGTVVATKDTADGQIATFDFVVENKSASSGGAGIKGLIQPSL
jgi:protocatechuate 3,4-dioxygenase beta subunit